MEKFLFLLLFSNAMTWNFETNTAIVFKGQPGSYFGYSVALFNNKPLVAATKANSTGALYKCDINNGRCENIVLFNATTADENRENMWLGVSLDAQTKENGYVVVCGHLWKLFAYLGQVTLGKCYILNKYMAVVKSINPFENVEIYSKVITTAEIGLSVSFTEDDNLLIGSPGYKNFKGAVIKYKLLNNFDEISTSILDLSVLQTDIYIGYSVSYGKFFNTGKSLYVAGAPRDGSYKGKVYIFQENSAIHTELEGSQLGEYFGASVLSVDVNNDGLTELFVGAPLYSTKSGEEEGRVYVYLSNGKQLRYELSLRGSSIERSRFGTSLASVGDINQDQFLDIAVGAPYELERGAIYIYHGSLDGIKSKFVQRIFAADIDRSLIGFGISISKPNDVDSNNYPDILVGSFLSDNAVLLRSRPIVRVYPRIELIPRQIDRNISKCDLTTGPCFKIQYCVEYAGTFVPSELDFIVELRAFRLRNVLQPKEYFIIQNVPSVFRREEIKIKNNEIKCYTYGIYILDDSDDRITPIQINATLYLKRNISKDTEFCKDCPILDPTYPHSKTEVITFRTGCALEDRCFSDLKLKANVLGLSKGELILGKNKDITIIAEVQLFNESAFKTEMWIYLPEKVEFIKGESCKQLQGISNGLTLICSIGNPFDKEWAKYEVKLDLSKLPASVENISIVMNLTTLSEEMNPVDNSVNITIPVTLSADISITGRAERELILLKKDESHLERYEFVHIYNVRKYLYSPISLVTVTFSIPTMLTDTEIKFLDLENIEILDLDHSSLDSRICSFRGKETKSNHLKNDGQNFITSNMKLKRNIDNELTSMDLDKNLLLNCETTVCERISCSIGPFDEKKKSYTFYIKGYLNTQVLRSTLKEWDNITFSSVGKVIIEDERILAQSENHEPDETKVVTNIVLSITLKRVQISKWVLPFSIICGIFLIGIIAAALLKAGFFRRKRKERIRMLKTKLLHGTFSNNENIE